MDKNYLNIFKKLKPKHMFPNSNNWMKQNEDFNAALKNRDFEFIKDFIEDNKSMTYIDQINFSSFVVNPDVGVDFLNKFLPFLIEQKINKGTLNSFMDKVITPIEMPLYLAPIVHHADYQIKDLYIKHLLGIQKYDLGYFSKDGLYNLEKGQEVVYENFAYLMCFDKNEALHFSALCFVSKAKKTNGPSEEAPDMYNYYGRSLGQYIKIVKELPITDVIKFVDLVCTKFKNNPPEDTWSNGDSAANSLLFVLNHALNLNLKKQDFLLSRFLNGFSMFNDKKLISTLEEHFLEEIKKIDFKQKTKIIL